MTEPDPLAPVAPPTAAMPAPAAAMEPVEPLDESAPRPPELNLPELVPGEGEGASLPLSCLGGVGLEVSAVVGRRRLSLHELLKLRQGTVVELQSRPGDAVELQVDGRCIARGEVVVCEGRLGVRILERVPAPAEPDLKA